MSHMYRNVSQKGFIALFFVLGISMTVLAWISISSSRLFEYIHRKNEFRVLSERVRELISCADTIIDREIRGNLLLETSSYSVYRNLFLGDKVVCNITERAVSRGQDITFSFVVSGIFHVNVQTHNGFVVEIQSNYQN